MANPEHLAILKQGVEVWNRWRTQDTDFMPDLMEAHLEGTDLRTIDLSFANLICADLRNADLRDANLVFSALSAASLSEAKLSGADLSYANLTNATLERANLTHARLCQTIFGDVDLSKTIGLNDCVHLGPSIVDHRTLQTAANSPVEFLRGIGLSDDIINTLHSVKYCSCFISYSTKDQDCAERLFADLQSKDVRCWFAPHSIQGGKKIHEQIDEAIRIYDRVLLVLSESSIASKWVEAEIRKAFVKEQRDSKRVLFPLSLIPFEQVQRWECFDSDTGEDLAGKVREYFIPDFSNWKNHDSHQQAFPRDLKAEGNLTR